MTLDDDLTEEQLAKLAREGTDEEKQAVARHPNTSLQTLLYLSKIDFAEEVDKNPLLPLYIESGFDEIVKILENVADQTERGERLEELASSVWNDVRYGVAKNANTPPDILSLLANDHVCEVCRATAENENTPSAILSILANDQSISVHRAAQANLDKRKEVSK